MPSHFHTSTPLAASAETMFDFHSDPHNLPEVMPPTLTLLSLKTDGPALEGRMIELHCRDWWIIPMRWTCRWKTVQRPHLLVDEIVKGPFALFEHEHRFEEQGPSSCIMRDTVNSFPRRVCGFISRYCSNIGITALGSGRFSKQARSPRNGHHAQTRNPGRRGEV
jgi:ligand-binding SRPBCC domain-containing protein